MAKKVLVLNGPGLPDTPPERLCKACDWADLALDYRQTDDFATLLYWIRNGHADAMVVNPTRAAVQRPDIYVESAEALAARDLPVAEIHFENIEADTASLPDPDQTSPHPTGMICGLGDFGYVLAITALAEQMRG